MAALHGRLKSSVLAAAPDLGGPIGELAGRARKGGKTATGGNDSLVQRLLTAAAAVAAAAAGPQQGGLKRQRSSDHAADAAAAAAQGVDAKAWDEVPIAELHRLMVDSDFNPGAFSSNSLRWCTCRDAIPIVAMLTHPSLQGRGRRSLTQPISQHRGFSRSRPAKLCVHTRMP